jgi:DNA-binding MarR family transcriptional regulator
VKRLHDTEVLDQLLEVVVILYRDATRSLARDGLTLPRTHVVWLLHHHGPMTQRALADAMNVTPRNVTGLVDGLVATGFVTREPHPTDRRAILVSLTEHGGAVLAAMDREHQDLAGLLFGGLSEASFGAFAAGLEHVLGVLREQVGR